MDRAVSGDEFSTARGITWRDRLRQGMAALRPGISTLHDDMLTDLLTADQIAVFRQLPDFDQIHLDRVCAVLRAGGEEDRDLLVAALLHDVGKVGNLGTIRLPHRVARVLLDRCCPRCLDRLARLPASRWRAGFALAVHHPALGAERAAALGCSARTCWLIAHHEDNPPPADEQLRRLIAADRFA
jgi:hypothetical protein